MLLLRICFVSFLCWSCALSAAASEAPTLPDNLVWLSNNSDPILGSPKAKKGGRYTQFMASYPLTFRVVGPDSNTGIRGALLGNQMSLTAYHPITDNIIPMLASEWAYGDDGRTVYYKLNPNAEWSDGVPVTADDFLFTLEFMRSKHIVAPWYNNYYENDFESVIKYDEHTISITGATVKPRKDLHYYYDIPPTPRHFHLLDKDWVRAYNWRIEPNTGPYQISRFKAGKFIEFERKKDWWAKDLRYFKYRYNVDTVRWQVIRDINIAFKYFEKGYLDAFGLILPSFWENKTKGDVFERGLVNKITFYNDTFRPQAGIYLNTADPILSDKNVRYGIAHAMNFNKVINSVLHGDYVRSNELHVGFGEYSNTAIKAREFDLAKANQYFDSAGWSQRGPDGIRVKDGARLSIKILYGASYHTDRLVILREEAKKAGLDLQLALLEPSTMYKNIMEKQHQAVWMAWSGSFRPQYWGQFHSDNAFKSGTNNITNTASPELDALIDDFRNGTEEAGRIADAHAIEQYIHDDGAVIPRTYVPFIRFGYWRWLQLPEFVGFPASEDLFSPFGSDAGFFWIDQAIKAETLAIKKSGERLPPVEIVNETYRQ